MAAYKMAAVKVTPPNDFPLGLLRSHMVVIHLFLMLCDLQRVVRDLRPTLYNSSGDCERHTGQYVTPWQVYLGDGSNALIVMVDIFKTLC
jgi:hypothetical protein